MTFIKDLISILFDKIKTWKQVIILICCTIIVNSVLKTDILKFVSDNKSEIAGVVAEEVTNKRDELVAETTQISPIIDSLVNETLIGLNKRIGANRSVIWIYHDNITMTNGVPYTRMSMTHERIDQDVIYVRSHIKEMQNIPVSVYTVLNKHIFENEYYFVKTEEIEHLDVNSYQLYKVEHIKWSAGFLIRGNHGKPLGVVMTYGYDNDLENTDELISTLNIKSKVIKSLLNYDKSDVEKIKKLKN